jgi:hypothetical protein
MLRLQCPPSFSQKVLVNEPPIGYQRGPLWRELTFYRAFFLHISHVPHECSPDKHTFYPSLEGSKKGASSLCSLKRGLLWKQTHISRSLLSKSFAFPSKGALPPCSPDTAPTERRSVSSALYPSLKLPSKAALSPNSPHRAQTGRRSVSSVLHLSLKSPRYTNPFSVSAARQVSGKRDVTKWQCVSKDYVRFEMLMVVVVNLTVFGNFLKYSPSCCVCNIQMLTNIQSNLLTPWSRVPLEKLTSLRS